MKTIGRIILYPFSILYGVAINIRNVFYDTGLLKETSFSLPVINVGNLSVGGAGKTPHVEYLIRLLQPYINVSVLSRGYKRRTKGFRIVERNNKASISGDEPVQYKRKYPETVVAVSESRALGIPQLIKSDPRIQTILLDDAFQHRSVKPSLNILLTPIDDLYTDDVLLPAGRLREFPSAASRADLIIVTKCEDDDVERLFNRIVDKLKPLKHQKVFFSKYNYGNPYYIFNGKQRIQLNEEKNIILISAIANTSYLKKYLEKRSASINSLEYEDHHFFSDRDIEYLKKIYLASDQNNTVILTTEKDAIRLQEHKQFIIENKLPIFALPVEVKFLNNHGQVFDQRIKDFLLDFKV